VVLVLGNLETSLLSFYLTFLCGEISMKKTYLLVITLLTLFVAVEGMAGASATSEVVIDPVNRNAQGSQASARFSDNDVELIGCGSTVTDNGVDPVFSFGFCQATDASGVNAFCATFSPDLVKAINGFSDYGFIRFTWNESEECISIRNSTQSIYIPAFKLKKD